MIKKILIFSLLVLITGCHTVSSNFQADTNVVVHVDSDNYEIVGDIKGEATYRALYLFPILPIFVPIGDNTLYGVVEGDGPRRLYKDASYDMAMYNAIRDANEKYEGGVDAIITPKYQWKLSGFPPFFWKFHTKIEGKGIRFITEKESAELEIGHKQRKKEAVSPYKRQY